MDFFKVRIKVRPKGPPLIYPDWVIGRSSDLMIRGRAFYAVWDEEAGLWSTDEYDVQRLVDRELYKKADEMKRANGFEYSVQAMSSYDSQSWVKFRRFIQNISDNSHQLDERLTFLNTEVKKTDYVSKKLPYSLEPGSYEAWDSLLDVLYSPEERAKIEWSIGSIVAGKSPFIQKFLVFYGSSGTGKSTILNIIQKLFPGYYTMFDAKALGTASNSFATEAFKDNPLVAIQHDGDLSRIDDNTRLNSIVSHEYMMMNEKYKSGYTARANAFLFMGTNQPVKISDAKSGIIRRLIDVQPSGKLLSPSLYLKLMNQIDFELGAIAYHCKEVFESMGEHYYDDYRPIEMMLQTDVFLNFIEYNYHIFKNSEGITLKRAYALYKEFCEETGVTKIIPQYKFREELRNYFDDFKERAYVDGKSVRSYYTGVKEIYTTELKDSEHYAIKLERKKSLLDELYSEQPAQLANDEGHPRKKWANVDTVLGDLDTTELHYLKVPKNHIVIDFDLVDEDGERDLEKNLEEASKWPPTYAELSRSEKGLHLHYIYTGEVEDLSSVYDVGIEIKKLLGDASLRRKLTKCNDLDLATLSSGLPVKEKKVLDKKEIQSEIGLRKLIARNLRKEIHPGTKPSIDFIHKILEDAYNSDLKYDVTDMRADIIAFAAGSTNQAAESLRITQDMKFSSEDAMTEIDDPESLIAFFDVEVYKNLLVVCWKYKGSDEVVKMINPSPEEVGDLFQLKLVGFNNRRYDNHILYGRYLGYSNEELFNLSQSIIVDRNKNSYFGEAYNISYADVYDFSSLKQGLKKFEIDLGITHMEMDIPWDEPAPEDRWDDIVNYCANDVIATEKVFESRSDDFAARKILAKLSGLSVNRSTQSHTAKIIFGEDKNPQSKFEYTDLSIMFPGYEFDAGTSKYKGEVVGEGGYVYSEPGYYTDVVVLDIASMHPTSVIELNLFGEYTKNFKRLVDARLAIKHNELDRLSALLGEDIHIQDEDLDKLSYALKIVINTVYGLTSAKFDNPFRDVRNKDNIVAKRGALFMIDLKEFVQDEGFDVVHVKTDSIKIPNATPEIVEAIQEYGRKYGYIFEEECVYDKFCLINAAVYVGVDDGKWDAVGAQFKHPYVFKSLFTHEVGGLDDMAETKSVVKGHMYLEFENETMVYVGSTGSFLPCREGGGRLWRINEGKKYAVSGTKDWKWISRQMITDEEDFLKNQVSWDYYRDLTTKAIAAIEEFVPMDILTSQ